VTNSNLAATCARHVLQQETVHSGANAEAEDPRLRMLLHLGDNLHIIPDITVSHEADDADGACDHRSGQRASFTAQFSVGTASELLLSQSRADRFHHFRPTAAALPINELDSLVQVRGSRHHRRRKQDVRYRPPNGYQVEGVTRTQMLYRPRFMVFFAVSNREIHHRAGTYPAQRSTRAGSSNLHRATRSGG